MIKYQTIKFILIIISICSLSYSQDKKSDTDLLIDKTINKYSRHLFLRTFSLYTIASIRDYETKNYWVMEYLPERNNKFTPQRDSLNPNKLSLIYNKVRLINNHSVFWTEPNDTSDYDFVVNTMIKYDLIDSFYINFDKDKIYEYDDYPEYVIDDGAVVVYYIIRRNDLKIIRSFRTRKYWEIYDYMEKLK